MPVGLASGTRAEEDMNLACVRYRIAVISAFGDFHHSLAPMSGANFNTPPRRTLTPFPAARVLDVRRAGIFLTSPSRNDILWGDVPFPD